MATLNRTFSVKNGIDVANTIIVDSSRNLSNIQTANIHTVNANTYLTVAGLNLVDHTNNAYAAANTAANTVSVSANGGSTLHNKKLNFINSESVEVTITDAGNGNANVRFNTTGAAVADAYAQANAAYLQANNAYAEANLKLNIAGGTITGSLNVANITESNVFVSTSLNVVPPNLANTNGERLRLYDFEQAGRPNYAIGVEQGHIWTGVDSNANTIGFKWYGNTAQAMRLSGNGVLEVANTVIANAFITTGGLNITGQANDAYAQANTARDTANGAYAQANGAYAQANGAYAQANGAYGQANGAYAQANGAYAQANLAFAQANLKVASIAVSGNGLAVSNTTSANNNDYTISVNVATTSVRGTTLLIDSISSTDTGNAATANAVKTAYDYANTKLSLTGGVIVGDITVDGNLFVNGVQTVVNTNSLTINDPIFLLANNNTTNSVGIGIVGRYGPTQQHTGLVRAHQDNLWYLFEDYDDHILYANNVLDTGNVKLATLKANISANSILLVGNTVATQANLTLAHDQANAAYNQANAAYGDANNRVAKSGDTMTGALTITTSGIGLSVANANVTYSLQVGSLNVTTNTVTTSSSGQVVLDKFPATQLASAKYFVQANSATDYQTTEIVLVQDATNVWITEYGSIQTGPSLGTFSADISSGDVRLLFNAANNINTIRSVRYGIVP